MEIEQYIRFVLRFLKENKVYYAYLYNARKDIFTRHKRGLYLEVDCDNYVESLSQYLYKTMSMKFLIIHSFCWEHSREGCELWENINRKFLKEYVNEIKKMQNK